MINQQFYLHRLRIEFRPVSGGSNLFGIVIIFLLFLLHQLKTDEQKVKEYL